MSLSKTHTCLERVRSSTFAKKDEPKIQKHSFNRKRSSSEPLDDADIDGDAEESDTGPHHVATSGMDSNEQSSGKSSANSNSKPPIQHNKPSLAVKIKRKPSSMEEIVTIHQEGSPPSPHLLAAAPQNDMSKTEDVSHRWLDLSIMAL